MRASNAPFHGSNLVSPSPLSGCAPLVHPPSSERSEVMYRSSFPPSVHHQPPILHELSVPNSSSSRGGPSHSASTGSAQASGLNSNVQDNIGGLSSFQRSMPTNPGASGPSSMPPADARTYLTPPPLNPYQLSVLPLVEAGHMPLDASIAMVFWYHLREKIHMLSRATSPDFFGETLVGGAMSLLNHAKDQVVAEEELKFFLESLHTLFLRTSPNVDPAAPAAPLRINSRIELWRSILKCFHRLFDYNLSAARGEQLAHRDHAPNIHRPPDLPLAGPIGMAPGSEHYTRTAGPMAPPSTPPEPHPPILHTASRLLSNLKNLQPNSSG